MSEHLAWRWMRRYKFCFLIGLVIFIIQVFLAYKSLSISDTDVVENAQFNSNRKYGSALRTKAHNKALVSGSQNSASDDEDHVFKRAPQASQRDQIGAEILGFEPDCHIISKEAISALQRAKTKDCRKHIAYIACAIQHGHFYAQNLPSYCPRGNHTVNAALGCYRDGKDLRVLSGYFTNFKSSNTPKICIELCLQSGFPYAGVQYGSECFCGNQPPASTAKLADSKCNMKCSGNAKEICGGYFSMNVFETGIAKFTAKTAETSKKSDAKRIRIAFLLTLNGRALRQVHRLLKALYSSDHVYYIHIDARQDYLYRQLLQLETDLPNVRLARKRYSTIWGGASLLTMLLESMRELLETNSWQWDFVINLSESDFPVKTIDKLVDFLSANREKNFVKSHGRETQRFIQKQGLDKTFVECDTHMWRIGDRRLPTGIQIDGGSDWVALSRTFVEYLISERASDGLLAGLSVVFRYTLLPAESFFHTVLRNSRFCHTYVDNNLHVTNWKRKLGCKCQYKHVVDWCGCSPNDFKPEDWTRLLGTEQKMLFFARKFEPIINQAILLQLEEWLFGPYTSEFTNLHAYWESFYNAYSDIPTKADDLKRTIGESIMRIIARQLNIEPKSLLELTHYMHQDHYKGFLIRFQSTCLAQNKTICEVETRIRPVQYNKIAKNSKIAKRLQNFEVASDFDQKEQMSRNFAKMLGPMTQLVLSFTLLGAGASSAHNGAGTAHSYNLTLLWISPTGNLEDYSELHIEDMPHDSVNYTKALLKQPLIPGIWTVKLIGRAGIYAQTKFLVTPLALENRAPISMPSRAKAINGGGIGHMQRNALPVDFKLPEEWLQHLPTAEEMLTLANASLANAENIGESLLAWIDELVGKFFHIRETCAVNEPATRLSTAAVNALPLCKDTMWSSLAPDPKSDIKALLKRR